MEKEMSTIFFIIVIFLQILVKNSLCSLDKHFETRFRWKYINFTWENDEQIKSFNYKPGEYIIGGIKIYRSIVYLALPRVKHNARITLASLPIHAPKESPLLSPYPSWEINTGNHCNTIQNILSMEIDKYGIMWVIDGVRVYGNTDCPPKIVLLDLNNNGKVTQSYIIPDEVCNKERKCFLNDIVVDGDYAYITDTTSSDPGLLVYSRKSNKVWKFRDRTMLGDPDATFFTFEGFNNTSPSNINGIAYCKCKKNPKIYFMAQTSHHIYSLKASIAKNEQLSNNNISKFITDEGTKSSISGGMICDTKNNIYMSLLQLNATGFWETRKPLSQLEILDQSNVYMRWPDSFSFDNRGNLYLITNLMFKFARTDLNINEYNFRILKLFTGTNSYTSCCDYCK